MATRVGRDWVNSTMEAQRQLRRCFVRFLASELQEMRKRTKQHGMKSFSKPLVFYVDSYQLIYSAGKKKNFIMLLFLISSKELITETNFRSKSTFTT